MNRQFFYSIIFLLLTASLNLKAQHIELSQQGKPTSIRGLSVVNDNTAWVCGSKGTIAITNDGGKTWDWTQVKGFERSDFRDIEAFSNKEAIIMSSGTPALILKTTDGGATWQEKYRNADTAYFFDAMDFDTPKYGLVLGDPIKGKFLLMETNDGGETWHPFDNSPDAMPGEACFAASGTCLRISQSHVGIVTGGTNAQFLNYDVNNKIWEHWPLPIIHSKPSQGAFSFAIGRYNSLFVGGDYAHDKVTDSTISIQKEIAQTLMILPFNKSQLAFQSCVEFIFDNTFLSTGTPGSNITSDGGKTWSKIDNASYNVCRKAKHGKLVLLAGDHGRIGIFKP
ncbi:MAG: WD40/YVTN/BNR-like repeat-containing protein [Sphingobacteriales bacterium]